jgi:hypothetical protein
LVRGEDPKAMGLATVPPRHSFSGDDDREKTIGFVARGFGAGKAAGVSRLL